MNKTALLPLGILFTALFWLPTSVGCSRTDRTTGPEQAESQRQRNIERAQRMYQETRQQK